MAITTSDELKTAIANWLHRDNLTARLDEFIALAEARFNRTLRVRGMEASLISTALVDGAVSLPTAFLAFKELRFDGDPSYTLEPKPLEWLRNQPTSADRPGYFAVTDTQVICWPTSGSIQGTYYRSLPSLVSNSTNWLLTKHPDLYLFTTLEEAAFYLRDDKLGQMSAMKAQALLDQVQGSDNANALNGGPLTVRAR